MAPPTTDERFVSAERAFVEEIDVGERGDVIEVTRETSNNQGTFNLQYKN